MASLESKGSIKYEYTTLNRTKFKKEILFQNNTFVLNKK